MTFHLERVQPSRLAELLALQVQSEAEWSAADQTAMLRQQLDAPLVLVVPEATAAEEEAIGARMDHWLGQVGSLRDLLTHSAPPLELLKLVRRSAKASLQQPPTQVARDLAAVLYYAAIALGWQHHNCRLTSLDDTALEAGYRWCLGQDWLDPCVRGILERGLTDLSATGD